MATGHAVMSRLKTGRFARAVRAPRLAATDRSPYRYHVIRYEDLITDPTTVLHKIASFIGLDVSPVQVKSATADNSRSRMREKEKASSIVAPDGDPRLSFVSDGGSDHALPDHFADRLLERFEPTMRRAGYLT